MDKKWISYWKKSLSDSLRSEIDLKLDHFEIEDFDISTLCLSNTVSVNRLIDVGEKKLNKKRCITDRASKSWTDIDKIGVLIAPFKIVPIPESLVYIKDRQPKFPFWYHANLSRGGELSVPESFFPIFQRKYLEPVTDENTEFTIASVDDVDRASTTGKEAYTDYREYMAYIQKVFELVVNRKINNYTSEGYATIHNGIVLLPDEEINAAIGIIHLYEKILHEKEIPELLHHFINLNNGQEKPPLDVAEFIEPCCLHLGQMGYSFPLSISQRKSLYTWLKSESRVFAVNGPPGTGKTTLLQSIVASMMVKSAIHGKEAPLILACSTNNQAVTNIIESFSKSDTREGDLQGRWLPDIEGYATYLPSNSKTESGLKGINYKKLNGEGLFERVENPKYLQQAKDYYQQKGSAYFHAPRLEIEEITKRLRTGIVRIQSSIRDAAQKWQDYLESEKVLKKCYLNGNSGLERYYSGSLISESALERDINSLTQLESRIIEFFKAESFFRKLFCWLGVGSALRNRMIDLRRLLRGSPIRITPDFTYRRSDILELIDRKIEIAQGISHAVAAWNSWKRRHTIKGDPPKTEKRYWDSEYLKIQTQSGPNCFYDELDVSLRHKAFQLALHYWEGRWLLRLEDDLSDDRFDKKGVEATENRWKRQSMLTPCFVSTFYMSPKFFSAYRFLRKGEDGRNIFDEIPLFSFIDLLIVDEAGQVSPEVGVATFALSKRAVVVGDTKQIEPVWSISENIDIGNLRSVGLIKGYDDPIYEKVYASGSFLSSSGSIMKMSQNASEYKEHRSREKGVMLLEHRRCYDEIINYCNVLAYNGCLKPLKGNGSGRGLYPPMYCIHVEGKSERTATSRHNLFEVKSIVSWLRANRSKIEERYGDILESKVGIITPFVGQKNSLYISLREAGFDVNVLKLGTVHALQGGERPIVIFSMVYGDSNEGVMFFDRDNKPNMLNVAVSRAQESFIVFANTMILDRKSKTPSGILSNHLVYENELCS
jgi:hypothetical protein